MPSSGGKMVPKELYFESIKLSHGKNRTIIYQNEGLFSQTDAILCTMFSEVDPTAPVNSGSQRYVLRDDIDLCLCTHMEIPGGVVDMRNRMYPVWYFGSKLQPNELLQMKRNLGGWNECPNPLGMISGTIPNARINTSSYNSPTKLPHYARLHSSNFWLSLNKDDKPWIQVDLSTNHHVTGLLTQGNGQKNRRWVNQLSVQTAKTDTQLTYIMDHKNETKIFDANTGPDNIATINFPTAPLVMQVIRIYPMKCVKNGRRDKCAMRLEILGFCNRE